MYATAGLSITDSVRVYVSHDTSDRSLQYSTSLDIPTTLKQFALFSFYLKERINQVRLMLNPHTLQLLAVDL